MELLYEIQGCFPRFNDNELDIHSKFMSQEDTKTTNLLLNRVNKCQKIRNARRKCGEMLRYYSRCVIICVSICDT